MYVRMHAYMCMYVYMYACICRRKGKNPNDVRDVTPSVQAKPTSVFCRCVCVLGGSHSTGSYSPPQSSNECPRTQFPDKRTHLVVANCFVGVLGGCRCPGRDLPLPRTRKKNAHAVPMQTLEFPCWVCSVGGCHCSLPRDFCRAEPLKYAHAVPIQTLLIMRWCARETSLPSRFLPRGAAKKTHTQFPYKPLKLFCQACSWDGHCPLAEFCYGIAENAHTRLTHPCIHYFYFSFKVCSGDVTALAEIATELLGEGLCAGAVANPEMVVEAVENVVSAYGGIKQFRKSVKNFAQFSVRRVSHRYIYFLCFCIFTRYMCTFCLVCFLAAMCVCARVCCVFIHWPLDSVCARVRVFVCLFV